MAGNISILMIHNSTTTTGYCFCSIWQKFQVKFRWFIFLFVCLYTRGVSLFRVYCFILVILFSLYVFLCVIVLELSQPKGMKLNNLFNKYILILKGTFLKASYRFDILYIIVTSSSGTVLVDVHWFKVTFLKLQSFWVLLTSGWGGVSNLGQFQFSLISL